MHKKIFFFLSVLIFISVSCKNKSRKFDVDISEINIKDVKIKRYEKALFSIDTNNLKSELKDLSNEYKIFLNVDFDDKSNLMQIYDFITDKKIIELNDSCFKKYPDLIDIEKETTTAFKYFKYYFPDNNIPEVYTYISNFDFENQIIFNNTDLIIALDMYLGKDFKTYQVYGIPKYKILWYNKQSIVRDCFKTIAEYNLNGMTRNKTLLDFMVVKGKVLYFLDAILQSTKDEIKINYTKEQLQWCQENEAAIWAFIIEGNFLYSNDYLKINKFINEGPFTSYFSQESPARTGWFIGWQIVKSYMNHNKNITLSQLFKENDSQKILINSKYKPKK